MANSYLFRLFDIFLTIKFYYLCSMNVIEKNIDRLKILCEKYKVAELYIFGSVLNNRFSSESDIDFIVTLAAKRRPHHSLAYLAT